MLAPAFTRAGIMEGLRKRHYYGTTGNRVILDTRVEFETDADNDYFSRPDSPGQLEVKPSLDLIESSRLWNGTFSVRFRVPWDAKPGDVTKISLMVTDVEREALGPFVTHVELVADEAAKPKKRREGGTENPRGEPRPHGTDRNASLELPEPIEVKKDAWERCRTRYRASTVRAFLWTTLHIVLSFPAPVRFCA